MEIQFTVSYILNLIKENKITFIGVDEDGYYIKTFKSLPNDTTFSFRKIGDRAYEFVIYDLFIILDEDDEIIALASVDDLSNPFMLKDILILPGHDSVIAIDIKTLEYKIGYIR